MCFNEFGGFEKGTVDYKYFHRLCIVNFMISANVSEHEGKDAAINRMLERMRNAKKLGILNKDGKAYSSREELY